MVPAPFTYFCKYSEATKADLGISKMLPFVNLAYMRLHIDLEWKPPFGEAMFISNAVSNQLKFWRK